MSIRKSLVTYTREEALAHHATISVEAAIMCSPSVAVVRRALTKSRGR